MRRNTFGLILIVLIGLAVLSAGLLSLQRIFLQERESATQEVSNHREALEQFAREALLNALLNNLAERGTTIDRAERDPLVDASGLYLSRDGQQKLPRLTGHKPGEDRRAIDRFMRLADTHDVSQTASDRHWQDYLALRKRLIAVLRAGNRVQVETTFNQILKTRARHELDPRRDLPYTLALIDLLKQFDEPSPVPLKSLLRDGIWNLERPLAGLQRSLLRHRDDFSRAEAQFFGERIAAFGDIGRFRTDDFLSLLERPPGPQLQFPTIDTPALLDGGRWFISSYGDGSVHGIHINLTRIVAAISTKMRLHGLIDNGDRVALPLLDGGAQPATTLAPVVESIRWQKSQDRIHRLYHLKTLLVVASGLLVIGTISLGVLTHVRKQRLLDLKASFVAAVSHELRTPLASTRLLAETLQKRIGNDPRVRDYPSRIIRDVEGLSFLVENVLSFSRIEKGQFTLVSTAFNLADILNSVHVELRQQISKDIRWSNSHCDIELEGDQDLLKLLFMNLARNACQYNSHAPVVIDVGARVADDSVEVRVRDNGVGIAASEHERIFDDFYRAGASTSRGTGLGLALCKRIAELHGGTISVFESGETGTCFRVTLPKSLSA